MTLPAPFIPPMLCERLTGPRRLADRGYVAEPKLDGQRAQLHVQAGRATACYSRRGLNLLRHAGMAWLRPLAWPFGSAVLDGEAYAGDGREGIQAVFTERERPDGAMALVLFDGASGFGVGDFSQPQHVAIGRFPCPGAGQTAC